MRTNRSGWDETFRTIITIEWPDGRRVSEAYGPFANKGAAKSAGTRASKDGWGNIRPEVSFHVERADTEWEATE